MSSSIPVCYVCSANWAQRACGTKEAVVAIPPTMAYMINALEQTPALNNLEKREILINWSIVDRNTHERINVCTECHKKLIGLLIYLL